MEDVSPDGARLRPAPEPAFTDTVQIGIVVRDLDATRRRYADAYGIGPWELHAFTPANAPDLHEDGRPVARSWRLATAMVGRVMWELIEPLDGESVYARFLAEKGEGVHHIAVATPHFDALVAAHAGRGEVPVLSGTFGGVQVAYLPTDRTLGVLLEVFSGPAGAERTPNADRMPDAA
ncbi:hypothetical protein tb265_40440 [Gemmatimonadetes bacterium T265]|nr:hypothetical protein tb265_40440 [Gemmatimonadetes bacterium T265]